MKTFTSSVSLAMATLVAAAAAIDGGFVAGAWNPTHGLAGGYVNAANGSFYIGHVPESYCPEDVEGLDCSAYSGLHTIFSGGEDSLNLLVAVPGGQAVYVQSDASLSFTQAHSAYMPDGSMDTGFSFATSPTSDTETVLLFNGADWLACLVPDEIYYQVFVNMEGAEAKENCTEFEFRVYGGYDAEAWEYV